MSLRAVIFDFGGVFTTSPVANFADYERANDLPERFIGGVIKKRLNDGAFARFERAEIDLDAFDAAFAEESRVMGHAVSGRTLVSLMKLDFRPDMIAALDRIAGAGFLTGCITNNMPGGGAAEWARDAEGRETAARVMARFDHVIESAKAGVRKPEPRIYQMMCEALGVMPEDCVFLDDLGVNLKPAAALGMAVIRVAFDDYRPALDELGALTGLKL
ncbi:MAG: HAD-IA family hydrolase [Paracoccaceae bacterium]